VCETKRERVCGGGGKNGCMCTWYAPQNSQTPSLTLKREFMYTREREFVRANSWRIPCTWYAPQNSQTLLSHNKERVCVHTLEGESS